MPRPVYLDHHATTPLDPRVFEAMTPFFTEKFGNAASRTHAYGWEAEAAVETARGQVARLVGAGPRDMIFTSGATEANNIAILGLAAGAQHRDHVIASPIEHPSVLEPVRHLEKRGFRVTWLRVDGTGLVDPGDVRKAITGKTLLVTVMAANHEIGALEPLTDIGAITRERGVFFHCDASQAAGKEPLDVETMGIDLLSLSGHKIYGPKGIGALYVRRHSPPVRLTPVFFGGGHEREIRPGTPNVPGIVGLGTASEIAFGEMDTDRTRIRALRDIVCRRLTEQLDGVRLNGPPEKRLAGNLNVSFRGVESEALILALKDDIAVSTGSACASAVPEPSHILRAIGVPEDLLHAAIRFGIGRFNTEAEVTQAANLVVAAVERLRKRNP
ncbi:MAG: cysteine desulfurase family protein [Planctomycetota bacterium]